MSRDVLFLLEPGFADPKHPGRRFVCPHGLSIEGLMCIPPFDENPGPHFALLEKLAREAGVEKLSMGMSGDYETAVAFGATSVRVGSAIFGTR